MASEHFERALAQGRARFHDGDWGAAYAAWEAGRHLAAGDEEALLHALALWASAASRHVHQHPQEAQRLLVAGLERLSRVRSTFSGLTEKLHDAMGSSLEALVRPWSPKSHRWPADRPGSVALELEHRGRCPYCGEAVMLTVAAEDARGSRYVEDCPVCCRPLEVVVRDGAVCLGRDDGP